MHRILGADLLPGELAAAVRDYLVRVRVRARAGTGLENVEREMFVELSFRNFFRRLDDEGRAVVIEQTEIGIRLRRRPFDQAQGTNERPGKSLATNRKIQNGPLRRRAVER